MQYSDGYKENTYLTWKGEKDRVTPEFESLSFYDERDGDVSLYCISLTDDWHKEERYPCWDAFCGIDGVVIFHAACSSLTGIPALTLR